MELRVARHTLNLDAVRSFYTGVLGFQVIGRFENHDGYDGVFLGKPGLGWHLEFTTAGNIPCGTPGEEDALVLYPSSLEEYDAIIAAILISGISQQLPQNPYWRKNAVMVLDPDNFPILISKQRIK